MAVWLAFFVMLAAPPAGESACSAVRMRILQDVAMERQGFEATLTLSNGSDRSAVTKLRAQVEVRDAAGGMVTVTDDPAADGALFFLRLDTAAEAGAVDGSGVVAAGTTVTVRWTLIPAVGAGGVTPQGVLYQVGAKLGYELDGTAHAMAVSPDLIWVAPMPDLVVDSFVPALLCGDDAWTAPVEPSVPATLGMRLRNIGLGPVRGLSVTASTPAVVDNRTGLAIDFTLLSSAVNGGVAGRAFQVDLGVLEPAGCAVVSWRLVSELMGVCSNAGLQVTHADALGGAVTALIRPENVRAHTAIKGVLVDRDGRDGVEDFLATDGVVYESDGVDGPWAAAAVQDAIREADGTWLLNVCGVEGGAHAYARLDAWDAGAWTPATKLRAVREDGSLLPERNVWVSMEFGDSQVWTPALNLFDSRGGGGLYRISVAAEEDGATLAIECASHYTAVAGQRLRFEARAVSSDGGNAVLSAERVPVGAVFGDGLEGAAAFDWQPTHEQVGEYSVRLRAVRGSLSAARTVKVDVTDIPPVLPGSMFLIH